jgi:hypothetical protein
MESRVKELLLTSLLLNSNHIAAQVQDFKMETRNEGVGPDISPLKVVVIITVYHAARGTGNGETKPPIPAVAVETCEGPWNCTSPWSSESVGCAVFPN